MEREWVAHCPFCQNDHAKWDTGVVWQCRICLFHIPAAHVWRWCWIAQKPAEARTFVQSSLWDSIANDVVVE
jgi:hypothetical protein